MIAASARLIAFVWTQVRQVLQQAVAIGACSLYVAVVRDKRPRQEAFMAAA
jgi:hypothetical protein